MTPTIWVSSGLLLPRPDADHLADRVAPEVELLHELFVDDHDFRRLDFVGGREFASRHQRDAERPEVARADLVEARVAVGVGAGLEALDGDVVAPVAAGRAAARARP